MSSTILGNRLERLRKERNFSLEDLRAVIHAQSDEFYTIGELEQAEYAPDELPLERVARICRAYDLSLIDLLIGSGYDTMVPSVDAEQAWLKEWDNATERLGELLEAGSGYLSGTARVLERLQRLERRRRAEARGQAWETEA